MINMHKTGYHKEDCTDENEEENLSGPRGDRGKAVGHDLIMANGINRWLQLARKEIAAAVAVQLQLFSSIGNCPDGLERRIQLFTQTPEIAHGPAKRQSLEPD